MLKALFVGLKVAFTATCLALFLLLMTDVWNKFSLKVTSTGVKVKYNAGSEKQLPCITFCVADGFKQGPML
jgi:hypothetical protein